MNQIFGGIECKLYICHVIFFIVLDLRLTKVGARRCSFLFLVPSVSFHSPNHQLLNAVDFLKYSVSCFHPMDFMLSLCQCKLTNNLHEKTHKPFMLGGCCRIAECLRPGGERS
ncbi:hypothetical protein GN309_00205 [Phocaeicola dorei]|uniref:Uncharacterized protein n=2 Tax=Phocaeicola TaxID=909656 RepID=A0A4R4H381_9BACT|nr:hypothetical protein F2Y58_11960 [Phocaeicola dorei]KAB3859936.1 hypothetical protein GAS29_02770 [Phocaeicola vulgatus]KAB3870114.1 hypothetical protein GAS07_03865 [Phocaeicola vulgatus]KAB3872820.1 hypothetical protein GAS14_00715 [Phocaeicola vulgatus]KAB3886083.1 hypothetical protein GAS15_11910 [Phocaeicola vulgatus]